MSDEPVLDLSKPFLRPGTPEDAPSIRALLEEVFPDNPKSDREVMEWQYFDNPYGEARIWVWEHEGRIVSHIATLRVPLQVSGRPETGGMVVDAATLPPYRRRGLFSSMRPEQVEEMVRLGVRLTLNYREPEPELPRPPVPTGFQAPLAKYILPIDEEWVAARLRVPSFLVRAATALLLKPRPSVLVAEEVDSPPADVGSLWLEIGGSFSNGIRREGLWWSWRYGRHPKSPYRFFEARSDRKLRGTAVIRQKDSLRGRFTYLMELLTSDREAAKALVAAAAAASAGTLGLVFLAIPGTRPAELAKAGGMRAIPRRLEDDPLTFLVREYEGSREEVRQQWTATFGDVDFL